MICSVWVTCGLTGFGQDGNGPEGEPPRESQSALRVRSVGFSGFFKVGHWTPVRVAVPAYEARPTDTLVLETRDPDGNLVQFVHGPNLWEPTNDGQAETVGLVKFGSLDGQLEIRWQRESGVDLAAQWSPPENQPPLPTDHRLVLSVAADPGVSQALQQRAPGAAEPTTHVTVAADELPQHVLAYAGVDAVVLATDLPGISQTDSANWHALVDWVQDGGRMVLTGSGASSLLVGTGALTPLVPGQIVGSFAQRETTGIEGFAGASARLDNDAQGLFSFPTTDLELRSGQVQLWLGFGSAPKPCIVRSSCGLGQVVFAGLDLTLPPFRDWPARGKLMQRLLEMTLDSSDFGEGFRKEIAPVKHVGFTDLIGQLRGALDQFRTVRLIPFSWIAGLAALYILIMGPLDYWLLTRWKRPEWTWFTFVLTVGLFTLLATLLAFRWKGTQALVNHVSVLDADLATGRTRALSWSHLYSPRTQRVNVATQVAAAFVSEDGRSVGAAGTGRAISWQGLPGDGFGGLNRTGATSLFDDPYQNRVNLSPRDASITLDQLPIAVWSSRSVAGRWWGQSLAPTEQGSITALTAGTDGSISGRLTNPWPVELDQVLLLHERWAYGMGKLGPRESRVIDVSLGTDLQALLTQRRVEKGRNVVTPWDNESTNVNRILQLLLFFDAAKGRAYTQMKHRYQDELDWSHHLRNGQAILWGVCSQPAVSLKINDQAVAPHQSLTHCRLLIPLSRAGHVSPTTTAGK